MREQEVVRICTYEKASGTYYLAQRYVWKTRLFSKNDYEWEYFSLKEDNSFKRLNPEFSLPEEFKEVRIAEYYCKEYLRVNYGSKVVKTYTIEEC